MVGGSQALRHPNNLPNVPSNMFYGGYALHGLIGIIIFWTSMSHSCVNEPLADAAWMFDWAGPVVPVGQNAVKASDDNPGTRVYIH